MTKLEELQKILAELTPGLTEEDVGFVIIIAHSENGEPPFETEMHTNLGTAAIAADLMIHSTTKLLEKEAEGHVHTPECFEHDGMEVISAGARNAKGEEIPQ